MEIIEFTKASDQQLVEMTISHIANAYDTLVERYRGVVEAMLIGRGVSEVEDISQESFIKAYLNLGQYNPQYSFGQWICAIARNLHIDRERRRKGGGGVMVQIDNVNATCECPNPEQSIITMQSSALLELRLGGLPENYRIILRLRFWDDLSYEEISEKLGLPMGTVKTQIHRGRVMLMEAISRQGR